MSITITDTGDPTQKIVIQEYSAAAAEQVAQDVAKLTPKGPLQRIANELDVGFVGAHGDTELFPGAGNTHQDFDIVTVGGVSKIYFVLQVDGSTYGTDERCRIAEGTFTDDGSAIASWVYSTELNIGHGQGFTAVVDGANVTFYTTRKTFSSGNPGKGFSKITWRGALTDDTDVTNYQLFGDSGSGHRFDYLYRATPCISTAPGPNGNTLLVLNAEVEGNIGPRAKVLVYDLAEVEAAGDPLTVDPIDTHDEVILNAKGANVDQGIACDGLFIYHLYGSISPESVKYITKTTLGGHLVDLRYASGTLDEYGPDTVRNDAAKGVMIRAEPEGLAVRDGKTYMGFFTVFSTSADIVTANMDGGTINLGCVVGTSAGSVNSPFIADYWTRTELAATAGAWNDATSYTSGPASGYTINRKSIIEVGNGDEDTGWYPSNSDWFALPKSPLASPASFFDLLYQDPVAFNIGVENPHNTEEGSARKAVTLTDGQMRLHDPRYGMDDDEYGMVVRQSEAATKRTYMGASGVGSRFQSYDTDAANGSLSGASQVLAQDGVNSNFWTYTPAAVSATMNGNNVFTLTQPGHLTLRGFVKTGAPIVADLPTPAAAGAGARYFVTDANATTFASIVAGGGANGVPVYCDGTNWRIG